MTGRKTPKGDDAQAISPEPTETRDERYARQTKEQFEHLGRFVQGYEWAVEALRQVSESLGSRSNKERYILRTILSHRALTALPLLEIFRAIVYTETRNDEDVGVIDEILCQISKDFNALASRRNELLHGTWFIGYASQEDLDFSTFLAIKQKITQRGLEEAKMPERVEDLQSLIEESQRLREIISRLGTIIIHNFKVSKNFSIEGKKWVARPPVGPEHRRKHRH